MLKNPYGSADTIKITLTNAVEAPFYHSQNTASVSNWLRNNTASCDWGALEVYLPVFVC